MKSKSESHSVLSDSLQPHGLFSSSGFPYFLQSKSEFGNKEFINLKLEPIMISHFSWLELFLGRKLKTLWGWVLGCWETLELKIPFFLALLNLDIVQERVNSAGLHWSNPIHFHKPYFQGYLPASCWWGTRNFETLKFLPDKSLCKPEAWGCARTLWPDSLW